MGPVVAAGGDPVRPLPFLRRAGDRATRLRAHAGRGVGGETSVTGADPETLARTRLRERQGAGARYDAPTAPAADLLLARRGTAYFARQLNALSDIELDGPSALAKQTR